MSIEITTSVYFLLFTPSPPVPSSLFCFLYSYNVITFLFFLSYNVFIFLRKQKRRLTSKCSIKWAVSFSRSEVLILKIKFYYIKYWQIIWTASIKLFNTKVLFKLDSYEYYMLFMLLCYICFYIFEQIFLSTKRKKKYSPNICTY